MFREQDFNVIAMSMMIEFCSRKNSLVTLWIQVLFFVYFYDGLDYNMQSLPHRNAVILNTVSQYQGMTKPYSLSEVKDLWNNDLKKPEVIHSY